jgi:hypothetical protein
MKARALAALAVLTLAAAIAPLPARAAAGPTLSYDLVTRETDAVSAGEYDGRMRLRISSDGIVSGTFMNTEGQVTDVTGGMTGTKIWIQIGNSSRIGQRNYFNGTFIDGKLTGQAPTTGRHIWSIEGTPAKH